MNMHVVLMDAVLTTAVDIKIGTRQEVKRHIDCLTSFCFFLDMQYYIPYNIHIQYYTTYNIIKQRREC